MEVESSDHLNDEDRDEFIYVPGINVHTNETYDSETGRSTQEIETTVVFNTKCDSSDCNEGFNDNPTDDQVTQSTTGEKEHLSMEAAIVSLCTQPTHRALTRATEHSDTQLLPDHTGSMANWMDTLIEMIDLMLKTGHFQHTGNWEGFLEAIHQFLPWCFALNWHNYARNLLYCYVNMKCLKMRNPDA